MCRLRALMINCNVCNENLTDKVYDTTGVVSITSVCTAVEYPTEVYYCNGCGHVQTLEMPNESSYYDETYNFLAESEEEDQIYLVDQGNITYRTQHQVTVLLSKLNLSKGTRILDYGCAKSSTMRELTRRNLGITPYLFDISERYTAFWDEFIEDGKWATYNLPESWDGHFDVVTSFFSLEHISKLADTLQHIKRVLNDNGYLYAIIPNTQTNPADLIVVDHPNHFTKQSIMRMLSDNDFSLQEIDDSSHRGAYIVVAKKGNSLSPHTPDSILKNEITSIGEFWKSAAQRIQEFEKTATINNASAIYGAGFYGSFLASNLSALDNVKCFIDQNKFLQGTQLMGRPIISPIDLPNEVKIVYVALNPKHSRKIIQDLTCFSGKDITFFYI